MGVTGVATGSMSTLHREANINVVSYGGTLIRTRNSFRGTVIVLHRGNLTARTGGTNEITTRNLMMSVMRNGMNIIIRIGSRASFITGASRFGGLIGAVTGAVVTYGPTSIRTLGTYGSISSSEAVSRRMRRMFLRVERGVRVEEFTELRNALMSCIRNRNEVNIVIRLSASLNSGTTLYNGSMTLRVTTVGPTCLSEAYMPTRILSGRGGVVLTRVGRSPGVTGGPRTIVTGVIRNGINGCCSRGYLMSVRFIGSNSCAINGCISGYTGSLKNSVGVTSCIHCRENRNVRGEDSSFTTRMTSVVGWFGRVRKRSL